MTDREEMPPRASVGMADLSFVGTPIANADQMKEWLLTNAPDGFNIMFTFLPQGLDDFVEKVVP